MSPAIYPHRRFRYVSARDAAKNDDVDYVEGHKQEFLFEGKGAQRPKHTSCILSRLTTQSVDHRSPRGGAGYPLTISLVCHRIC